MKYNYFNIKTPVTSKDWINMSLDDRIQSINKVIIADEKYKDFKIVN